MKLSKLKAWVGVLVLASAASSHAAVTNILWNADSYSGFDFTLSGTGSGYSFSSQPLISPSGLWQFKGGAGGGYDSFEQKLYVAAASYVEFLGQYPASTPYHDDAPSTHSLDAMGYHDTFALTSLTLHDGQIFDSGDLRGQGQWSWSGLTTIDITSIPDNHDPSTWSWNAHIYASGPSLAPVPEPGTVSLCLAGSLLVLAIKKTRRS